MKIMTHSRKAVLRQRGFTRRGWNHGVSSCLFAARSIAVCAIVTQCLSPARAADPLPVQEPGNLATPAQGQPYSPQGYEMKRYQAFARQAEMPAIKVTDKSTLEVGGSAKTDLSRLAQLSTQEKEALAGQFGVPAGVIGKVIERVASHSQPSADQFAKELRTAVVDYRFLQGEWKRYNPPAEGRKIKADALQALQGGDISKAWELYDGLQRPAPPGNLRIVAQP